MAAVLDQGNKLKKEYETERCRDPLRAEIKDQICAALPSLSQRPSLADLPSSLANMRKAVRAAAGGATSEW